MNCGLPKHTCVYRSVTHETDELMMFKDLSMIVKNERRCQAAEESAPASVAEHSDASNKQKATTLFVTMNTLIL